ncbi:MAG TPA: alpha amylase C-terminal domain-containing protein, partial [Saliniramus sp.]|nr:alpha amylase C-terminal domain-containing protein [Saliniramus sp.]
QMLLRDLNKAYAREPALHASDADPAGFDWIVGADATNSVFAFLRSHEGAKPLVVVLNMTPVPREGYRVGVPHSGAWKEIVNSDAAVYGGSNMGNGGSVTTTSEPAHGRAHSLDLVLPPLSALVFRFEG